MKKLSILFFLIFFSFTLFSQVPTYFKYQALIRNSEGAILANNTVLIRISILSDSFDGLTVYSEKHSVTTNAFGLVSLNIGGGMPEYASFEAIDWGRSSYFLKIEVAQNNSDNFVLLGVSPLLSVPYALYAQKVAEPNLDNDSENEIQNLTYENGDLSISKGNSVFIDINDGDSNAENELITNISLNGSLLEITEGGKTQSIDLKNLAGLQSLSFDNETNILSLQNGGQVDLNHLLNDADSDLTNELISNVLLDGTTLKITEAGILHVLDLSYLADNQTLSFDSDTKTLSIDAGNQIDLSALINDADADSLNEIQTLSMSGTQLSISGGNTISLESSLALSDADGNTKLIVEESPNDDIIRFYSQGNEVLRVGKEAVMEFLTSNTRIGNSAGKLMTTGNRNTLLGYLSGSKLTTGSQNTFVGSSAGENAQSSSANTFIGANSGKSNTTGEGNAFLGVESGFTNESGAFNTFIGNKSGELNETGSSNVFVGYQSGNSNLISSENTFVGNKSGYKNIGIQNSFFGSESGFNSTGNYNSFYGNQSGFSNTDSEKNTFIGFRSGYSNTLGNENVFLGSESGFSNTLANANTFIGTKAGFSNQEGAFNTYIGYRSGEKNRASSNTFVGYQAGLNNEEYDNVFVGKQVSELNSSGSENVYLGNYTAQNNGGFQNVAIGLNSMKSSTLSSKTTAVGYESGFLSTGNSNVFLGYKSGYNELNSNRLYIENSDSNLPLIYGEFDNDILQFNAKVGVGISPIEALSVNGAIRLGNTQTSNAGTIRFDGTNFEAYNGTEWLRLDLQFYKSISDKDAETQIELEQTDNDNTIRFTTAGIERLQLTPQGTLNWIGSNLFFGENSGLKATTGNNNLFIGYHSGAELTSASSNLSIGHWSALNLTDATENSIIGNLSAYNLVSGNKNTFLGFASGYSNIDGNSNVFLGYEAGYNETSSDKLYIQNSKTREALIYGDFLTQELIFNANVSIDGDLPTEKLEVNGAIKIGNTLTENEGTIRWNGSNFEAFTGSVWKILDFQYFNLIRNDLNTTSLKISQIDTAFSFDYAIANTTFLKIKESTLELLGNNIFIGQESGKQITIGDKNTFIGYKSGANTTTASENVFLGYQSGINNSTGSRNTFIGFRSGNTNSSGVQNVFLGFQSGHQLSTGQDNVFLGYNSGYFNSENTANVYLGSFSGYQNTGNQNVFLGMNTGRNNLTGSGNVFIGTNAGLDELGSNKLYISNSDTNAPLIYGEFDNKVVEVNAKLNVKDVLHLSPLAAAPSNPEVGDLYLGTDNILRIFVGSNGGEWKIIAFQ